MYSVYVTYLGVALAEHLYVGSTYYGSRLL